MEKKNVIVTLPLDEGWKSEFLKRAEGKKYRCEITFLGKPEEEDLLGADVIIGSVPAAKLKGKKLDWVQLSMAGADAYVVPGVLDDGTVLTNSAGAYGMSVSEHMIALTFALIKKFELYRDNQRDHCWKSEGKVTTVDGSTVLVLGLGDIGGRYARMVKALGAYVIGVRRNVSDKPEYVDEVYSLADLGTVIGRADIIAMALPGVGDAIGVIDSGMLSLAKDGAYLVNAGRANAIDQEALADALRSGKLAGAGIDVTTPEPLGEDSELWDIPNLIITPHVAGQFSMRKVSDLVFGIAADNLARYADGEPLQHVVNRQLGY